MFPFVSRSRSCGSLSKSPRAMFVCLCLLMAVFAGGCVQSADGPCDTYGLDFTMPPNWRPHGAVIFMVDGVNGQIFHEMLDAGELPAIKKYFVDRGLYAPAAVANTPSITLVNETSLVTGLYPGHHGVIGNNWFDRNKLIWRNYETVSQKNMLDEGYFARNIYEYFPDELTISDFFQPHRGTTKFFENRITAGPRSSWAGTRCWIASRSAAST